MLDAQLIIKKNQAYTFYFVLVSKSDHESRLTGKTVDMRWYRSDSTGGLQTGGSNVVTEISNGIYECAVPQDATNESRGIWLLYATDASAKPVIISWHGVDYDPLSSASVPPTAAAIADAVWDEAQSGHTTSGTFGKNLDGQISTIISGGATGIANAVWNEATSGHTTAGTFGKRSADDSTNVSTISSTVSTISTNVTTLINRIGAFTGSGINTVLGFLKAIMSKASALTPSDVGGTFDNTTDSIEALRDRGDAAYTAIDQWGIEVEEAFTTTAGVETRLIVSVKKNGLRQDVYALDPTATCALAVREHGAGSDLYTISATTVSANGKFQLTKSTPGYTTDRVYDRIFTVVISGTTRTFSVPVPVHP